MWSSKSGEEDGEEEEENVEETPGRTKERPFLGLDKDNQNQQVVNLLI